MGLIDEVVDAFGEVEMWDFRVGEVVGGKALIDALKTTSAVDGEHIWGAVMRVDGSESPWHGTVVPEAPDPKWPFPGAVVSRCLGGPSCDEPECVVRGVLES